MGKGARSGRPLGRAGARVAAAVWRALALAAALGWLALSGAPALAHAVLLQSDPPAGAALDEAPGRVTLRFNEPVEVPFNPLAVHDQQGRRVDRGNARLDPGDPRVLVVDLPPLPAGFYTVTYRVTSADGHPVTGAYGFRVGTAAASAPGEGGPAAAPGAAPAAAPGAAPGGAVPSGPGVPPLPPAAGLAHGLAQGAAAALAGLPAFVALVWLPAARAAGVAVGAAEPGTVGYGTAGGGGAARGAAAPLAPWFWGLLALLVVAGAVDLSYWAVRAAGEAWSPRLVAQALLRTRVGHLWLTRAALGLAVSALGAWAARRARVTAAPWWGACAAGAALLATFTLQSHAAAAGNPVAMAADWLHLAAAAVWTGGLVGFTAALAGRWRAAGQRGAAEQQGTAGQRGAAAQRIVVDLSTAVGRFSPLAVAAVAVLVATGLYGARLHVPGSAALPATGYGRALLAKLALLVPLLALGATNLWRRGQGPFRLLVRAELVLIAAAFVAAGFLTSLPPARVELALRQGPFVATQAAGPLTVTLEVVPARVGFNTATVTLRRGDGTPATGAIVALRVNMVEHDMGQQNPDAREVGGGQYRVDQVVLGMHGTWRIEVVVLTPEGQEVRTAFAVRVPEPVGP